jgi:RHH-type transcriptional regulator, rel operon repressor / antitoxin RelB
MSSNTLSIRVDDAAKERLAALAKSTGRTSSFLAAEAINAYLDINEWQVQGIRHAMASLDAGSSVAHGDVKAWAIALADGQDMPAPAGTNPRSSRRR